jgi:hypothetical protein
MIIPSTKYFFWRINIIDYARNSMIHGINALISGIFYLKKN